MADIAQAILRVVDEAPGIHVRALFQRLPVSSRTASPVLEGLVARGAIHDVREAGRRRFYLEARNPDALYLECHPKARVVLEARAETLTGISDETGMPRSTVLYYRKELARRGLWAPSNHEHQRRLDAYALAANDAEAANAVGISKSGFGAWRRRQGLPPKGRRGVKASRD